MSGIIREESQTDFGLEVSAGLGFGILGLASRWASTSGASILSALTAEG